MSAGVKITEMLMRLLALQPLKMHYFWGRCLSWFVSGPMHYRRDVVMINLARSFPEKKYSELRKIADDFYKHFGDLFAETFWFAGSHDTKRLRDSHICEMEHADELNRLYNDCPGVIVLTSHLGNWELTGGILNYVYAPDKVDFGEKNTTVVYKELSNSFWDKVFGDNRCAPRRLAMWSRARSCVSSLPTVMKRGCIFSRRTNVLTSMLRHTPWTISCISRH